VVHEPGRLGRLPDDALLAALALGEPGAAAVFVRRFQRRVFGVAVTITGDRSLAEDVAQTAFERAWRHAGSFDARRGTVATWLLAITRNVAIDAVRVRRPVAIDPVELAGLLAPASFDPEATAVVNDQVLRLRKRLDALSPEQRRAVLLATVAGRSMAEIAAIERIPVATAKTRLRDGLRRLRRTVGSEVEP
jgi:RNA polymerase sigma-70 factor (ECF subfamily)